MTLEFDAVILEFVCVEVADKAFEDEGVTEVNVLVLTPDRRSWKNSMAARRPCRTSAKELI